MMNERDVIAQLDMMIEDVYDDDPQGAKLIPAGDPANNTTFVDTPDGQRFQITVTKL